MSSERTAVLASLFLVFMLAACGSDGETVATDAPAEIEEAAEAVALADEDPEDEDHDDEDHDDEDHSDEDGAGLGAHEHGSAELSVAWIDADVAIDLISPTENVFGFEYEAETDEDLAIVADRTDALTTGGLISINDGAECELSEPATADVEFEGSHAEITVSWAFSCTNPADVANVDLSALFAEFPGFEDIDVEWVSESSQSSAELSPEQSILTLES